LSWPGTGRGARQYIAVRLLVEQTIQAELHIPDDQLGSEEDITTGGKFVILYNRLFLILFPFFL
jgi:hypothetical protein